MPNVLLVLGSFIFSEIGLFLLLEKSGNKVIDKRMLYLPLACTTNFVTKVKVSTSSSCKLLTCWKPCK